MGRKERSGNGWYAFKNIMLALGMPILAGIVAAGGMFMMPVLGYFLFISGGDLSDTSTGGSALVSLVGLGMIVLGAAFMDNPDFANAANGFMGCIGALFVVYMGFRQIRKKFEPYCIDTLYEHRANVLTTVLCLTLIFGGILTLIGSICYMAMDPASETPLIFTGIGIALCIGGMIAWISYTSTVLTALRETGRTINSYKRRR